MAYLSFERVTATVAVKTAAVDLTVPGNTNLVEIQADTQPVRYTCDGTGPSQTSGMVFAVGDPPKAFLVEDVLNLQFIRGAGSDGALNFHYYAGRDV